MGEDGPLGETDGGRILSPAISQPALALGRALSHTKPQFPRLYRGTTGPPACLPQGGHP